MRKTVKPKLALCVRFEEDFSYRPALKVTVTVDYWREEEGITGRWSGVGFMSDNSIEGYTDLQFNTYVWDDAILAHGFNGTLEYRKYSTKLHDAELMVKTLRRYYKKAEKLNDSEGYAKSFGQAVNRMARIIGAKKVCVQRSADEKARTGTAYVEMLAGNAVFTVDGRISNWLKSKNKGV